MGAVYMNSSPHACVTTLLSSYLNNLLLQGSVGGGDHRGEAVWICYLCKDSKDALFSKGERCWVKMLMKDLSVFWA